MQESNTEFLLLLLLLTCPHLLSWPVVVVVIIGQCSAHRCPVSVNDSICHQQQQQHCNPLLAGCNHHHHHHHLYKYQNSRARE